MSKINSGANESDRAVLDQVTDPLRLDQQQAWQELMSEINCAKPNQEKIRQQMADFGIPYSSDPLSQLASCVTYFDLIFGKRSTGSRPAEL